MGSRALRHLELAVVLSIGLVLTALASWLAHSQAERFQSQTFGLIADAAVFGINTNLQNLQDFGLGGLARFFESSDEVTEAEFRHFTEHLLRSGLTRHWAWAPRLPVAERAAFEQSMRETGRPEFHIWGGDASSPPVGGFIYPVVHYVSSMPEPPPLGLDLASMERVRRALESARQTGLSTFLPELEGKYVAAFGGLSLLIQPTTQLASAAGRDGFVMSVVDFDAILEAWAGEDYLAMEIWQIQIDEAPILLAQRGLSASGRLGQHRFERPLLAFGEAFVVRAEPGIALAGARTSLAGPGTALAGLLLTMMLATVVMLVVRRRETLEQAVRQRTAALEEFRIAIEQTSEGIALSDMEGRIRFVNRAWAEMHGYTADELIGNDLSIFHTPEQMASEVAPQLARLRESGQSRGEVAHRHRDGHTFPTRMSTSLAHDEQGQAFGMIGIARDITDEVQQRQREEFSQRFRSLAADLAGRFVTVKADADFDRVMQDGLAIMGELFEADRSYLFRFSNRKTLISNTHEWCARGIPPALDQMQAIPTERLPWWMAQMETKRPVQISEVAALPEEAVAEKNVFMAQGIQSMICLPMLDAAGELTGFLGFDAVRRRLSWPPEDVAMLQTIADITAAALARHEAVRALAESESSYRDLAMESRSFRWEVNMEGLYTQVDPLVAQVLGYQPEELVGKKHFFDLTPEDQRDEFRRTGLGSLRSGKKHIGYEHPTLHRDGQIVWLSTTLLPVRDPSGRLVGARGSDTDITARKQAELQLQHLAHHDLLTGLPNRVLLADRLQQAMLQAERRGELLGVACLDLDAFKPINDRYGHAVGDRLLVSIAQRMRDTLREGDTVARLGGDEFALVLVGIDRIEDCQPLLRRLLDAVARPIEEQGHLLSVSVSLGITFFPQSQDIDADQLLRQADQAMYQAKLAGRNRFHFFDAAHDRLLRERNQQVDQIRQGLDRNEFLLHYQPKVDMKKGCVIGVEALIRWQHPERGLLPPSEFLPLLDGHQLMLRLGDWVIETVLSQITRWREAGLSIPASLNVHPLQLAQPDFMQGLRDMLLRYPRVQRGDLEIEVLETSALDESVPMVDIIHQGEALGVAFSLDDFGTGYSSLSYLKRLPVSTLKIDRSFVREMLVNTEDLAILQGVIGLARTFQQQLIAEGVETEEHGRMLLRLGCNLGQGYAIARPMPAEEVLGWLDEWHPPVSWQTTEVIEARRLPLLQATVAYRAWIKALGQMLEDGPAPSAPLGEPAPDFVDWLSTGAGSLVDPAKLLQLDQQLRTTAEALRQLADNGALEAAKPRFHEVLACSDELLRLLEKALVAH